ncbi:disease resistance protein RPV1-like isoform X2 [Ziziphus jujuba]|uniref:ADP-ribosyl cyclase/cyclic ADP-ribose hydrolase n=1 Tax=Ziziphus jujuba TaxID=326968 RepID=A0ABM4ABL5_ZIZJJ|nr:disease resistance protein RPV1-like isoform X2 [Ziziphus jujuba]
MANSNSNFSSSSPPKEYDVFLSFRGEDTRKNFSGHLRNALRQKGIHTFFDDDKLERGKEISPELLKAIEDSYTSIIILSENYASSSWCLTELGNIVEFMGVSGKILPIFYHVDPGHVRNQSGSYGEAFKKHEGDQRHSSEKVQSWRDALKTVGNLAGWHVNDTTDESKFIQDFIVEVSRKLGVRSTKTLDGLYGMHSRLKKFDSFVCRSSTDVRFIGICGMGGIGKTTLAKAYYNQMSDTFEGSSFLANVREVCKKKENGRVHLQNQLLSDTLKDKDIEIGNVYDGIDMIRRRLRKKSIIVVLDDVDKMEQIVALAEKNDCFGAGSVVIVTTRDESLLTNAYKGSKIYKVEQLNYKEALRLFSLKAFPISSTTILKDYKELSDQVIEYANGLPLALEVLGSFLCGKSKTQWMDALERLKNYAEKDIVEKLRISFDDLRETDQQIFLDIACFFNGYDKDYVIEILESCELYPTIGIQTLVDKSLVVQNGNKLSMHDLLQEMGKDIVRQESRREPGRRSRIWDAVDFKRILQKKTGTDKIEGIQSFLEESTKLISFEALSNLKNLRLLMIFGSYLSPTTSDGSTPNLEYLSDELRLLEWNGFPYKNPPSSFEPNELVHLKLIKSNIQQLWDNPIELYKLKSIDLSDSRCFRKFENFEVVPNLEKLILKGCIKLSEIHPSITVLKRLALLNLKDCTSLINLPRRIQGLNSLKILDLHGCSKLCKLPEDLEELKSLEEFDVTKSGLRYLPPSIFLMGNLKTLCCEGIVHSTIKTNIINRSVGRNHCFLPGDLSSLNMLNLSNCDITDESFPGFFGCFVSLVDLNLSGNPFSALHPSINKLSNLRYLNLKYCEGLRKLGPELPSSLKTVWVDQCSSLNSFLDPLEPCQLRCSAFCADCFELVERQDSNAIAFSSLKRFIQDPLDPSLGFEIVLPGSEIPAWFMEQSSGPSINIELDPNWCTNKWIGLALSVCFCVESSDDEIYCEVESRNWRSRMLRTITDVESESFENHLWLFYLPRENFPEDWNSCSNLEFSFYAESTNNNSYFGPCGVRLVYEKDIENFNQIGSEEFSDQEDVSSSSTSKRIHLVQAEDMTLSFQEVKFQPGLSNNHRWHQLLPKENHRRHQ